jgi:predicted glycosyltransferase
MRILVDIGHPAHVHFFKHAIGEWLARGQEVIITSRDKDLALSLLDRYGFKHTVLSRAHRGTLGLGLELAERVVKLVAVVRQRRPAVLTGIGGTFIAPVGGLTGIPAVIFTDTEHARISNAIAFPLADAICTPACYEGQAGDKQVTYAGYQELAYLHPGRFTPDPSLLKRFDLKPGETYVVVRLVAWASGHDTGDSGFRDARSLVRQLSCHARVLISSEKDLPPDLIPYRISASPELIHHLLAFAALYIGESATMASESAILGVPAIYVSTSTRGYTNEQERKYGLTYTFSDPQTAQQRGLEKALELLNKPNLRQEWQEKRNRMLRDMVDVTDFIVDAVERHAQGALSS